MQHQMEAQPSTEYVPTPDGGYKLYQAAGKLKGRKALITGGESKQWVEAMKRHLLTHHFR